jgi:putative protease
LNIELLSPAPNLQCGIEAINHGADAVYIGGPRFGARAAANNTIHDIGKLCDYAHIFGARVYVAMNTILYDSELAEAELIINAVYNAGADALIIQDMGITQLNIPPIALHASTQADNRSIEHIRFLENEGFAQVVLARELSLDEISKIAGQTSLTLEAFVHGSLCVSLSGQCYASAALCGRSANRGECAQYCRLPWTLTDAGGKTIVRNRHLLSLKDLNRSEYLEEMINAGVRSFKIEGRLKSISYVKNITAWYRRKIDTIFERRYDLRPSSRGDVRIGFEPCPAKSFNRGFTPYFLNERPSAATSTGTPKSIGEPAGCVIAVRTDSIVLEGAPPLHNGDGMVFFNASGDLEGFRINRAEGRVAYPYRMPGIKSGTALFRNFNSEFETMLAKTTSVRRLPISMIFAESPGGFTITVTDETGVKAIVSEVRPTEEISRNDPEPNIRTQLSRLGATLFEVSRIGIRMSKPWFIPSSFLANLRRRATEQLMRNIVDAHLRGRLHRISPARPTPLNRSTIISLANVSNRAARTFYLDRGAINIEPAFELSPRRDIPLMHLAHCLRFEHRCCPSTHGPSPFENPFFLESGKTRLKVEFDCKNCCCKLMIAD